MLIFFAVLAVIVLGISIYSTAQDSELWVKAVCWGLFFLSLVGLAELFSSFVTLEDESFRMRKNFRVTSIPRADIESVAAAKGCPITLVLQDGSRVDVPDLGGQGIDKSLRAWLKAT